MSRPEKDEVTQLLKDWRSGDRSAMERLGPIVYETLKGIAYNQMNRERADHTLQATVLVNDAYMQLLNEDISWVDSAHFRSLAATIMRRTLIDHARQKNAQKRGGDADKITLIEGAIEGDGGGFDVLELDDLLNKLAEFDERKARVIELTFFGGLNYEEVGEVLEISKATVDRELRVAKAWLYNELNEQG